METPQPRFNTMETLNARPKLLIVKERKRNNTGNLMPVGQKSEKGVPMFLTSSKTQNDIR